MDIWKFVQDANSAREAMLRRIAPWLDVYPLEGAQGTSLLKRYHDLPWIWLKGTASMEDWLAGEQWTAQALGMANAAPDELLLLDGEAWTLTQLPQAAPADSLELGRWAAETAALLADSDGGLRERRPSYTLEAFQTALEQMTDASEQGKRLCQQALSRLESLWEETRAQPQQMIFLPTEGIPFCQNEGVFAPGDASLSGIGYPAMTLAIMLTTQTTPEAVEHCMRGYMAGGGRISLLSLMAGTFLNQLRLALLQPDPLLLRVGEQYALPILEDRLPKMPFLKACYPFLMGGY